MAGGQSFTGAAGAVGLSVEKSITGQASTSAQGLVSANNSGTVALVGEASSTALGAFTLSWGQDLSGSESTSAHGSVAPGLRPTDIVGQVITSAAGSLTPEGDSPVTVNITGEESTFSAGNVQGGYAFLSGVSVPGDVGTVVSALDIALTGVEASASQGPLAVVQEPDDLFITGSSGSATPSLAVALVGEESASEQGAVVVTGDSFSAAVGEEDLAEAGVASPELTLALTGVSMSGAQYPVGAPGGATLTGSVVVVTPGDVFTTNDRDFQLSGVSMSASVGDVFASPLAFVSGQEIQSSAQEIGPRVATLTGQEILVAQGSMRIPAPVEGDSTGGWGLHPRKKKDKKAREDERIEIEPSKPDKQRKQDKPDKPEKQEPNKETETAMALAMRKAMKTDTFADLVVEKVVAERAQESEEEDLLILTLLP